MDSCPGTRSRFIGLVARHFAIRFEIWRAPRGQGAAWPSRSSCSESRFLQRGFSINIRALVDAFQARILSAFPDSRLASSWFFGFRWEQRSMFIQYVSDLGAPLCRTSLDCVKQREITHFGGSFALRQTLCWAGHFLWGGVLPRDGSSRRSLAVYWQCGVAHPLGKCALRPVQVLHNGRFSFLASRSVAAPASVGHTKLPQQGSVP